MVLDREEGGLAKMLPLFKLGLGGRFGQRPAPGCHGSPCADEVGAIRFLLEHDDASGAVQPRRPGAGHQRRASRRSSARCCTARTLVPVPPFGPKLLLGRELADELLFTSMRVMPAALQEMGYRFVAPDLETGLRTTLAV